MPEEFDFFTCLRKALEDMPETDEFHWGDYAADGESGILTITMSNGGTYKIQFNRMEQ